MTFVLTRLGDNLSLAFKCKGTYNYKLREMLTGKNDVFMRKSIRDTHNRDYRGKKEAF